MRKRGRKSGADLSVVPINCEAQRPLPPGHLTAAQSKVWREIVDSTPPGWFRENDVLLELYCRHVCTANQLAKLIDAQPVEMDQISRLGRLLSMRERETRMVSHLATKMRLTQQARMHSRTAGRAFDAVPTCKPWEDA